MRMRMKISSALMSALLIASTFSVHVFANEGQPQVKKQAETDQVIVTFKDGAKKEMDEVNVSSVKTVGTEDIAVLKVPEGAAIDTYMAELEERNDIENVEPDYMIDLAYTPTDPYFSPYQYHHKNIEVEKAWNKTMGSPDVIVAVLDAGFDLEHPDLINQIVFPYSTVSTGMNIDDHGTHVAGIIAGQINNNLFGSGVAPNTSIMPVDVFVGEQAYSSDVIEGIYYAVAAGADIINMSIGGYNYSTAYNNAIQYAYQSGVVIVAAAGNDATYQSLYPASYENVISVGSTDSYDELSYFSNYGYNIDVVAPGTGIYSTLPYNNFGNSSGTSMATPIVAGVAALVLANEPDMTNDEVVNRLLSTTIDLGSYGFDYYYGNGLINAKQALQISDIPSPIVYDIYDYSTTVSGYLPFSVEDAKVIVRDQNGMIGTVENYSGWSYFDVPIPQQHADEALYVSVVDFHGNESEEIEIRVMDGTAPSKPVVNDVPDSSTWVTGTGEIDSIISVKTNNIEIGTGRVNSEGKFSITIPKQQAGAKLTITAADLAGNISETIEVLVVDWTAPSLTFTNKVTHHSTRISGTSEAAAKITVNKGTELVGAATTDTNGKYEVTFANQVVGTTLSIMATDAAGNSSEPIVVTVVNGNYPDLKVTHWALEEIMYLADDQIIGGYPNGDFQPEKNTTRAEAAKILALALDLPIINASSNYKDVSSKHWAKDYIAAVSKAGLFNGNPDGTFGPENVLKRAEMAKIISIAYQLNAAGTNYFKDVKTDYWAQDFIAGLYENGITTGYPDQTFRPSAPTTRAEYSVFLARALNEDFR